MNTATLTGQAAIDARKERGLELAKRLRIVSKGNGVYVVPASANGKSYTVIEENGQKSCSCPDFELRREPCKHLFAIEYQRRSTTMADGSTQTTETLRITYRQDWPAYNDAQRHEKDRVASLLHALCSGVVDDAPRKGGNQRIPLADRLFAVVMKVYGTLSSRRSECDMLAYAEKGYLRRAISYNAIIDAMDDAALTPILRNLIEESAAPLRSVETTFAPDSTGFSTCTYERWFDAKYGREQSKQKWLKAHAMVGVKTNVVTSVIVTDSNVNDAPMMPALVESTRARFEMKEVVADKAYLSRANLQAVVDVGAMPFIPFKSNSTIETKSKSAKPTALWIKLFHYFQFQREEFLAHYHARSNVEATFSAVKRLLGGALRSKTRVGQENELLSKFLAFNLTCLIHAARELGIEPLFWQERSSLPPAEMIELPELSVPWEMIELPT